MGPEAIGLATGVACRPTECNRIGRITLLSDVNPSNTCPHGTRFPHGVHVCLSEVYSVAKVEARNSTLSPPAFYDDQVAFELSTASGTAFQLSIRL